jgi:hypothetical protein
MSRPYREQEPAEKLFSQSTGRALHNHIRSLRGDPRLSWRDEGFLASLDQQLYETWFTKELSEKQMAWLWDITDRLKAMPEDD